MIIQTMMRKALALGLSVFLLWPNVEAYAGEKLRIASEGFFPPFNSLDANGKLVGFDIDIGFALCKRMGVECEFVKQDWDNLIPGLIEKKYDAILASMSITAEREKLVSFTVPYYSNMLTFMGRKNAGLKISDDALVGKSIGTQQGTVAAEYLQEHFNSIANIKFFETQDAALADLSTGKLDLVLGDNLPSYDWLQTDSGKDYEFVGEFIDIDDRIGIAVRKEDNELREKLNQALIAILEDGTYQAINEKYFPFSIYF